MRIFDYPKFAEPFRNQLRENAETLAKKNGIEIEFVRKRDVRKVVKAILTKRGDIRDWFASSRQWSPVRATNRGTTRVREKLICGPMTANVFTTIST